MINYETLFQSSKNSTVSFALVGANGGFARSLLMQVQTTPRLLPAVLCDIEVERLFETCISLGFTPEDLRICENQDSLAQAIQDGCLPLIRNSQLIHEAQWDILVEATGIPHIGYPLAVKTLELKRHVAMVSKETESVVGPHLANVARDNGVVFSTVSGDQPANLVSLVTWARVVGLEVVAAGKSSEYDIVVGPTDEAVQLDEVHQVQFADLWDLGPDVKATLERRAEALETFSRQAPPDYCEMNLVSNSTGLLPSRPSLSYPIARATELADIFCPIEDGGILERTGVVDVFSSVRKPDEVSFAGGVFIVVRANDPEVWEMLAAKGHVVSRNRKYACVYWPFHFMGVETPMTLLLAVLLGHAVGGSQITRTSTLAGKASRDLIPGEVLEIQGHHHVIEQMTPQLFSQSEITDETVPYYLAAGARVKSHVKEGELLQMKHLEIPHEDLIDAWRSGNSASLEGND